MRTISKSVTPSNCVRGQSNGVKKNREPGASRNFRSQQARFVPAPSANPSITQASQKPAHPPQESEALSQARARKRKSVDEGEQPQKCLQRGPSPASAPAAVSQESVGVVRAEIHQSSKKRRRTTKDEPTNKRSKLSVTPPLSVRNLEKLQEYLGVSKDMEPACTPTDRLRKRAPSRQTSFSDLNETASTRSQRSTGSLKFYRYEVLARFGMYIQHGYPPTEIKDLLEVIFERQIPQKRKHEISRIAQETAKIFSNNTCGGNREDDFLETLIAAFRNMFLAEKFNCPRKADWNPGLKPAMLEVVWNLQALGQTGSNTGDVVDRPSKRQQPDRSFPSPSASQSASQQLIALPHTKQDGAVKNPRPDCTIGHHHSTYTDALEKLGLPSSNADDLLALLQREQMLLSDPTVDYVDVRLPIQTIEAKAYATGKTIFEAENQAVVSGACMVNQQQQLIDLYDRCFPSSKESKSPFAFSVCTEGPLIGFWVHYARMEHGFKKHYMRTLYSCDGALADQLETLLVKWEQLMNWYENEFLKETAKRLYDIANDACCAERSRQLPSLNFNASASGGDILAALLEAALKTLMSMVTKLAMGNEDSDDEDHSVKTCGKSGLDVSRLALDEAVAFCLLCVITLQAPHRWHICLRSDAQAPSMLRKGILNDCHCNDVESQSIETPGGRKATEQATVGWQGLAAECSWLRDGKKDTE